MRSDVAAPGVLLLYRSSNGDEWHFVRDDRTGDEYVLHSANPSSGGAVTRIEAPAFLTLGNGPEQQELRRLLGTAN
ncbi:hypothetical protein [Aureimonas pseudogalii]|uniref:hypothetical protein n=1 Tax=Aureimonas pseudogalii TaxID=1744844 RepID=UPI001606A925|nr:hypothetical protein [Aureimonas pseudogalii]